MNLEWIAEDSGKTLAHAAKLSLNGITSISPLHALTSKDLQIASKTGVLKSLNDTNIIVSGESLAYNTFNGAGTNRSITDALFSRLKGKMVPDKINLLFTRIPKAHNVNGSIINVERVADLQAAGLVGIQLEANASAILPPLNSGLSSYAVFKTVYERTKTEIQTFRKEKEIIGYIPTTNELGLIPKIVKEYVKDGVRFFAVDFSSSPLNRWLIRTVVRAIRDELKIKGKAGEKTDKQYYLHVFDVSPNKKTISPVAPITDVLAHAYGVDSTSGVIWGGGNLIKENLRYFNMQDYGAYQLKSLEKFGISHNRQLTEGSAIQVYEKLRTHKLIGYKNECQNISKTISSNADSGYAPYILSKTRADKIATNILMDVQEIKAG